MLIAVALIVIYIILGVLYESTIHPLTILSTLPSAGLGALLILMAVNLDLSVIAIIGIILLIGIVKKNGIMLVDLCLASRAGAGPRSRRVNLQCLRLALPPDPDDHNGGFVRAASPLMIGTGNGAELRQPLGYTIVGRASGVAASDAFTRRPVVYLYLDKLASAMKRRRHAPVEAVAPAE